MGRKSSGLSKNLLQMKFMQRTKEKQEESSNQETDSKTLDPNLKECSKLDGNMYLVESSYEAIENLRFGRMSYKGMNLEIERLINGPNNEDDDDEEDEEDVDVSKEEMVKRYSTFRGGKRFKDEESSPPRKKANISRD